MVFLPGIACIACFAVGMGAASTKAPSERGTVRKFFVSSSPRQGEGQDLPTSAGVFARSSPRVESPVLALVAAVSAHTSHVVYLQSMIRRWRTYCLYERALRRQSVALELFETEKNYVANLTVLCEVFEQPLLDSCSMASKASAERSANAVKPIVTEAQVRSLFSSAKVLLQFQQMFLERLRAKIDRWHYDQTIGDVLADMTPFMRLYAEYVGNFSEATELFRSLTSRKSGEGNARFKAFLECAYQTESVMRVGELDSFMVQPVQRLPRYKMFLETLIKYTPKSHEDFLPLSGALKRVSEVVNYVNEKKRAHDSELQVYVVYGRIEPPIEDLVVPGRALIAEGAVLWASRSFKPENHLAPCKIFLFSDLIVIAKPHPNDATKKLSFVASFDLRTSNFGSIQQYSESEPTKTLSGSPRSRKHAPSLSANNSGDKVAGTLIHGIVLSASGDIPKANATPSQSASSSLTSSTDSIQSRSDVSNSSSTQNTSQSLLSSSIASLLKKDDPQTAAQNSESQNNTLRPQRATSIGSSFSPRPGASSSDAKESSSPTALYYLEAKVNGQWSAMCWNDENEANEWRSKILDAAEKVHQARETNPTTSEGRAHAFKASITKQYLPLSSSPSQESYLNLTSTSSSPSVPEPTASPSKLVSSSESTPMQHKSSTGTGDGELNSGATSSPPVVSTDSSPEKPQRQLRKFAERRKQLGMDKKG